MSDAAPFSSPCRICGDEPDRVTAMGRKFGEHLTNSPRVDSCNGRLLQGDDDKITPGCYNICFNCGCLSVYTEDLALRRPTNTERYDAGIEVNRVIIAIKQRGRLR